MTKYLIAYIATLVVFLAIDMIWLGLVAKSFYAEQLGNLKADTVRYGVAVGFYCMYVVGIVLFAIKPALASPSPMITALSLGAAFGFFCYATYDLTNLAVLRDWPVKMSIVDIIWGACVTGVSAAAGLWLTRAIATH